MQPLPARFVSQLRHRSGTICLAFLMAACNRPAAPVGPALLSGTVAGPGQEAAIGQAPLDAPQGPLHLRQASTRIDGQDVIWEVEVTNPSSERLGVTLVLRLTDAEGELLAHDELSFLLGGGESLHVREPMDTDAATLGPDSRWQLESWARRLPPPEQRLPRVSG